MLYLRFSTILLWLLAFAFPTLLAGEGVLPLIPDYNANRQSGYVAYHQEGERFQYHAGLRFDRPLIFMPADNFRFSLNYLPAKGWKLSTEALFVSRQHRLEADQDFLPPPPAYALFDLSLSREWTLPSNKILHLRAAAQNLLNTRYRDYLDRQRYFADAAGRNLGLRISYE